MSQQEVTLAERFHQNGMDYAAWCRQMADSCPWSRSYWLARAKEAEAEAKSFAPRKAA